MQTCTTRPKIVCQLLENSTSMTATTMLVAQYRLPVEKKASKIPAFNIRL